MRHCWSFVTALKGTNDFTLSRQITTLKGTKDLHCRAKLHLLNYSSSVGTMMPKFQLKVKDSEVIEVDH